MADLENGGDTNLSDGLPLGYEGERLLDEAIRVAGSPKKLVVNLYDQLGNKIEENCRNFEEGLYIDGITQRTYRVNHRLSTDTGLELVKAVTGGYGEVAVDKVSFVPESVDEVGRERFHLSGIGFFYHEAVDTMGGGRRRLSTYSPEDLGFSPQARGSLILLRYLIYPFLAGKPSYQLAS